MLELTQDQWILVGLVFLLGMFAGMFLLSGGSRKWKERYRHEKEKREALEVEYEKAKTDWREKDSLREAALKNAKPPSSRDRDGDGIPDDRELPPRT